jgi:hypothetical protein
MTAQAALRAALRDIVGPAARAAGFKGSAPTWRSANSHGDWAVVNVQSSRGSTAESLRCVINLAVAPAPWLDWRRESLGSLPKSVTESLGLWRDRRGVAAEDTELTAAASFRQACRALVGGPGHG